MNKMDVTVVVYLVPLPAKKTGFVIVFSRLNIAHTRILFIISDRLYVEVRLYIRMCNHRNISIMRRSQVCHTNSEWKAILLSISCRKPTHEKGKPSLYIHNTIHIYVLRCHTLHMALYTSTVIHHCVHIHTTYIHAHTLLWQLHRIHNSIYISHTYTFHRMCKSCHVHLKVNMAWCSAQLNLWAHWGWTCIRVGTY